MTDRHRHLLELLDLYLMAGFGPDEALRRATSDYYYIYFTPASRGRLPLARAAERGLALAEEMGLRAKEEDAAAGAANQTGD